MGQLHRATRAPPQLRDPSGPLDRDSCQGSAAPAGGVAKSEARKQGAFRVCRTPPGSAVHDGLGVGAPARRRSGWLGGRAIVLQSLLLTALGGVLGAGGALLASQWQAREARRIRREQNARDDRYRLTADRIRAYSAFHVRPARRGRRWAFTPEAADVTSRLKM